MATNVSTNDLLTLLGQKEAEIFALNRTLAQVQAVVEKQGRQLAAKASQEASRLPAPEPVVAEAVVAKTEPEKPAE